MIHLSSESRVLNDNSDDFCVILCSDSEFRILGSSESGFERKKVLPKVSNEDKKACEAHQPDMVP